MSDNIPLMPEHPLKTETTHSSPERSLIQEERPDLDLASENADLYAMAWGFRNANDLKNWGKSAEQERIAHVSASKSTK